MNSVVPHQFVAASEMEVCARRHCKAPNEVNGSGLRCVVCLENAVRIANIFGAPRDRLSGILKALSRGSQSSGIDVMFGNCDSATKYFHEEVNCEALHSSHLVEMISCFSYRRCPDQQWSISVGKPANWVRGVNIGAPSSLSRCRSQRPSQLSLNSSCRPNLRHWCLLYDGYRCEGFRLHTPAP